LGLRLGQWLAQELVNMTVEMLGLRFGLWLVPNLVLKLMERWWEMLSMQGLG